MSVMRLYVVEQVLLLAHYKEAEAHDNKPHASVK